MTAVALFVEGMLAWLIVQNLILPDRWAVWLAERRNFPTIALVWGVLMLISSLVFLVPGLWTVFARALQMVHFQPWVWILFVSGLVLTLVSVASWFGRRAREAALYKEQGE